MASSPDPPEENLILAIISSLNVVDVLITLLILITIYL